LLLLLFFFTLLAACNPRGIPGSVLLTPIGLPTQTASATFFTPTDTPTPTPSLTETYIPLTDTPTPQPSETPTPTDTLTFTPVDTSTPYPPGYQTPTFTRTISPTRTPSRTRTGTRTRAPSYTPTITNTPTPPTRWLRVDVPGPLSRVSSPIHVEGVFTPSDDGIIYFELYGEDARLITRQAMDYRAYINRRVFTAPEVSFEISAAAETGRLVIYTLDSYGRTIALTSIDLILIQVGDNEVYRYIDQSEPYILRQPVANQVVTGGVLQVSGLARRLNENPLIIELVGEDGGIIATRLVDLPAPEGELSHMPFYVEIPYTVDGPTPVRLILRQNSDDDIPGTISLTSILIELQP
ncbi:MAG TPA: hypothetical protein VN376_10360, partial [Longilinea sp.]|nr:hypothetical protein [Longilinea sp.]